MPENQQNPPQGNEGGPAYAYVLDLSKQPTAPPTPGGVNIEKCQANNIISHTRMNEVHLFLNGLAEIRMALNLPKVSEADSGIGERAQMEPLFDRTDIERLRKRYLKLLDRYLFYTQKFESTYKKIDEKVDVGEDD